MVNLTQSYLRKFMLLCFLFALQFTINGQVANSILSKINTVEQAKDYINKHPTTKAKLFVIESNKDTTKNLLSLYNKKIGFIFKLKTNNYKILNIDSVLSFRVSYIYISGEKFSKKEIDSIRQEIIFKYNTGSSFLELVPQYNMDGNQTGDTNWFVENMMAKDFEIAVKNHKKGEIFTIDIPSNNWHHIVLKTYDDSYFKKITILKN